MKKNTLGRNAFLNGIKTACSILFPFISFAYCSRIIGANGLGMYSFGQSIISYLLLIAALGIPNYAIREGTFIRDNKEKLNIFISQVFTISCIMTIVAYLILGILMIIWPKMYDYRWVIIIQSIQILLTTIGADWINSIYEDYFYLAIRYIIIQILSIILLMIFIKSPKDLYLYTFISMMSNAGGNILNLRYLRKKKIKIKLTKQIDLRKHITPIFILFFNCVASTVYLNSDITMLGIFDSNSAIGVYTVSSKIYSMIKSLINAIVMVTLPRFSAYIAQRKIDIYTKKLGEVQEVLMLFASPIMVGIILEGEKIINIVAGNEYATGVLVLKILAVAIPFAVEACFLSYSILMPNRKDKMFLLSTLVAAVLNIILNIILLPKYGMYAAALTTLIAEIVVVIITTYSSKKVVKFSIDKKLIIQILIGCMCIGIVCKIIDSFELIEIVQMILDVIGGIVAYLLVLLILKCKWVFKLIKKCKIFCR